MASLLTAIILTACITTGKPDIDAFTESLRTTNYQMRGDLYAFTYQQDLSSFTYADYLKEINQLNTERSRQLLEVIRSADDHLFIAEKDTFFVGLKSEELCFVLFDNASSIKLEAVKRDKPLPEINDLKPQTR